MAQTSLQAGTEQGERQAPALRCGYLLPDELSLAQRLRLSLAQARGLRFVDPFGSPAGDWGELLGQDLSLLLADIAAYPAEVHEARALEHLPWLDLDARWQRCWALVGQLDLWCHGLDTHEFAQTLAASLQALIEQELAPLLRQALQRFAAEDLALARLHPAWTIPTGSEPAPHHEPDSALLLRQLWVGLCRAVRRLRQLAQAQLADSLHTQTHEPAIGLLLTLLQLLQQSRAPLNAFPERFKHFYHRELLGLGTRPAAPERAHLLLERAPGHATLTHGVLRLPAGTRFGAGKNAQGQLIEFASSHEMWLGDARVERLLSLRLEHDPLISPEREFGYASRSKAQRLPVLMDGPASWPMLGAQTRPQAADIDSGADAELGLAIAAGLLALREGEREIRVRLHAGAEAQAPAPPDLEGLAQAYQRLAQIEAQQHPPRERAGLQPAPANEERTMAAATLARGATAGTSLALCFLLARCLATEQPALLAQRLGRLFAVWLCGAAEPREADLAALRAHARRVFKASDDKEPAVDDPLSLIYGRRPLERSLVFDRVFRGLWRARLSTEQGWLAVDEVFAERGPGGVVELSLRLRPEQPAIVACQATIHGPDWPALPVLQLQLQPQTRLHAYSLLQQLPLGGIGLAVQVRGLRQLWLHNQLGRLDPSKPFAPFGPLPDAASYLMLGSPELATKPLKRLRLHLLWAALPGCGGGFAEHYRGYPGDWSNGVFRARWSLLANGLWQPAQGDATALFDSLPGQRRIATRRTLELDASELQRWHRAEPSGQPGLTGEFSLASRQGFFRLGLAEPTQAFGHALYPQLMTEVLSRNSRLKRAREAEPLPQPPYTPQLEQLSVDYEASELIGLLTAEADQPGASQLFQQGPFGRERLRPGPRGHHWLPRLQADGQLFIGLRASELQGPLSLLFRLRAEQAADAPGGQRPQLRWAAWCGDAWRWLEAQRLLHDGTQGLLRSGLIVLDLPADLSRGCPALPGPELFWLRLSADWGFELLAGFQGVQAQGVEVLRLGTAPPGEPALPPGRIKSSLQPIAGLGSVRQVDGAFGARAAEDDAALHVRAAERLHHKGRAATAWDVERLVLDAFPEVIKVRCLGGRGRLRVVVVAAPPADAPADAAPRLDAATLVRIHSFLSARSSPHLSLTVRNCAYARVQVRCALSLVAGVPAGSTLRRLNLDLLDYLSPWRPGGRGIAFDWRLHAEELEAFARARPEIASIGAISLLHITQDDNGCYRLGDSARLGSREIAARRGWTLLLPMRRHLLELQSQPGERRARVTGLARLALGSSFIIGAAEAKAPGGSP
jgi:hypothetical protein